MPVVEVSALVLFSVVAIGNYLEAWRQTSMKHRTRMAYHEMVTSCVKLQTLGEYLALFSKYQRHLTKEELGEYRRLVQEGEKWTSRVRPGRPINVPLPRLEEQAAGVKAFVGSLEHFIEPYQKAIVGYASAELVSIFEYQLPFFRIDLEKEKPWGTLHRGQDGCLELALKEYGTC